MLVLHATTWHMCTESHATCLHLVSMDMYVGQWCWVAKRKILPWELEFLLWYLRFTKGLNLILLIPICELAYKWCLFCYMVFYV